MVDITMNIDEALELDYLVQDRTPDPINVNTDPSNYNLSGLEKRIGIFEPNKTGTYTIDINGQTYDIKVVDIPDSVVHRFQFEESVTDSVGSLGASTNGGVSYETTSPLEGSASIIGDGVDNVVLFNSNAAVNATQNGIAFEFLADFGSVASGDGIFTINDQNTEFNCDFSADGTLRAFYQSGGNNPIVTTTVQTGTQYRVVVQYNASTNAIEIGTGDSVNDSNTSGGSLNNASNDNRFLSATVGGGTSYSEGVFDELRVHNQPIL